ncbi:hypothetical protein BGX38DRAFT_1334639 [Terfezia claveryi]|nr:hypothetical protein BGX38DRAFT_1334639 [Terfezia claveryi]
MLHQQNPVHVVTLHLSIIIAKLPSLNYLHLPLCIQPFMRMFSSVFYFSRHISLRPHGQLRPLFCSAPRHTYNHVLSYTSTNFLFPPCVP